MPVQFARMRKSATVTALLTVLLLLPACTMWKEGSVKTWDNSTGGEAFTRLFWEAVRARNWTTADARVGAMVSVATDGGRFGRDEWLQRLRSAELNEVQVGDLTVRPNLDTQTASYTLHRRTAGGESVHNAVTVWQKVDKEWVIIAHAETRK